MLRICSRLTLNDHVRLGHGGETAVKRVNLTRSKKPLKLIKIKTKMKNTKNPLKLLENRHALGKKCCRKNQQVLTLCVLNSSSLWTFVDFLD